MVALQGELINLRSLKFEDLAFLYSLENNKSLVAITGIPILDDKGSRMAKYSYTSSLLDHFTTRTK